MSDFCRRDVKPCHFCGKGLGQGGVHFYRVRVQQLILDHGAISREAGLEAMMGGNVALAAAFSPDPKLAHQVAESEVLACGNCGSLRPQFLHMVLETDE